MTKRIKIKNIFLVILGIIAYFNCFSTKANTAVNKPLVVVIDAGHGGKDPGAVSKGIKEKDIVLGVALKLGKLIKDNYPDVSVVYTRNTDVFVPLIERSRIANKAKADLFISIHANYCGTPSIRGTETFVLGLHKSNENLEVAKKENSVILLEENYKTTYEGFDPNLSESYIMFELVQDVFMEQSVSFADEVQQQFKTKLGTPDRSVKQAGFLVLRQVSMPSVLVEVGFLSNLTEANYMNSNEGQQNIANSIYDAFRKFENKSTGKNIPVAEISKPTNATNKNNVSQVIIKEEVKPQEKLSGNSEVKQNEVKSNNQNSSDSNKNAPLATSEKLPATNSVNQTSTPAEKTLPAKVIIEDNPIVNKTEEPVNNSKPSEKAISAKESQIYYSVQIGASLKDVEATPGNFKGIPNVRKEKSDKYYRFFVGKEDSFEKIKPIWLQIRTKFPEAFVVSFENDKRTIITSTLK